MLVVETKPKCIELEITSCRILTHLGDFDCHFLFGRDDHVAIRLYQDALSQAHNGLGVLKELQSI